MIEAKKEKPDKKVAKKTYKSFDPKKFIDTEPTLKEAVKKHLAVITFGRMNPITLGHEKLANKIAATAIKMKGEPLIFLSHSTDAKKNPLSYEDKFMFAQKAFGKMVVKSKAKQIIEVAQELQNSYNNLIMVVGSDRVEEFEKILEKYNKKEFTFDSVGVVSAGQRDPDAEGLEGMSASKMRTLASDNDLERFKKGLPSKLQGSAGKVLNSVRKGMGLSEDLEHEDSDELDERVLDNTQRRKMSMSIRKNKAKIKKGRERAARKKAPLEKLKGRANKQALGALKKKFSQGKSPDEMSTAQKNQISKKIDRIPKGRLARISKKLLPAVRKKEQERFANRNKNEMFEDFMKDRLNESFEDFMESRFIEEASLVDMKPKKRFHMLLNKDNSCKIDKRFKMYKVASVPYKDGEPAMVQEDSENVMASILDLQESVEDYMNEAPFGGNTNFLKDLFPEVERWFDRTIRSKEYKAALGQYLKFKKDGVKDALVRAAKVWNVDARTLDIHYDKMVSAGVMKESNNQKFEKFMAEKSGAGCEGTDELVKKLKKDTPKEESSGKY